MSVDDIPKPNYSPTELPEELKSLPDRVSETLVGKTLLITGGSGFLGKVLIEKILRKSPDVEKIYLLMRAKKGKEPKQRVEELFSSPLFDLLKSQRGLSIIEKVEAVNGDVSLPDLGLSAQHRQLFIDNVNIIFHGAATIRFDEPLRKAVLLNTRGTKLMLELATLMKKFQLFVHISTSYCHLQEKVLEEKAYPPPTDPHKIIRTCELMSEELVETVAKKILGDFPNSYAYTKCLSEGIAVEHMNAGLPVIILRPSIVIPIWKEPLPGWTDNINGPTGLLIGAGKGVIRTMYCDNQGYADYLPVDITVNGILLATWNYLGLKDTERTISHLTSSMEWQVSWQEIIDMGKKIVTEKIPLNNAVWYPGGSMKKSKLLHQICVLLFHMIPAYFLDTLIMLSGHKPILCRVQERINKGFEVFEYYANNQWEFRNDQIHHMRKIMNRRERFEYKIDGEDMDLYKYFEDCILAARIYILKEMPETLPGARRHMRIMYWVDFFTKCLFYGLVMWFFFSNSSAIMNFVLGLFKFVESAFWYLLSGRSSSEPSSSTPALEL
ncbi:fatty acyl-CoA reductase 1 [Nilaparvata lugens]|uniref:Fatty acyl-CoA reductase n=1 Tax=Nilaparvata lugens TaxID=108931 RepID=A0A3S7L466_NILLU|nr:fatty acyl-CoA reductase 1 [Nilaparvata lugens]XP_039299047.1 fatty acyl-CoA reductase 1 [Nilaparvata lugens]AWJ25030.1 fatty acyl-CoA reductase [Nilaparvata lugens]